MKKQLINFSIYQSSKVLAVFGFIYAAIFCVPAAIIMMASGEKGGFVFLLFPFLALIFYFVINALFFWIYNMIASAFGGIEFETKEVNK